MKINEIEKLLGLSKANIRYYENEGLINPSRTENGFIDIGNIDIAPFKNRAAMKTAIICLSVLFILGIAYSFICNTAFIENDNQNYKSTLPEINMADTIETVKVNKNVT